MCSADRVGQRDRDLQKPIQRHAVLRDQRVERAPLDELHGQEVGAIVVFHGIDRDDVGMIQRGGGARLLLEAAEALLIGADLRGQHLDGDLTTEARIAGAIDLRDPPAPSFSTISYCERVRPIMRHRARVSTFPSCSTQSDDPPLLRE